MPQRTTPIPTDDVKRLITQLLDGHTKTEPVNSILCIVTGDDTTSVLVEASGQDLAVMLGGLADEDEQAAHIMAALGINYSLDHHVRKVADGRKGDI